MARIMIYTIRHVTRFSYEAPISESVMEARMQPRTDQAQRCVHFGLSTSPLSRVLMYQDHEGNAVHHFDIPGRHARLAITAEALVECDAPPALPDRLAPEAWDRLDAMTVSGELWAWLAPSTYVQSTALLGEFAAECDLARQDDPLTTMRRLTAEMFRRFQYRPQSTRVDSPIDDALRERRGVCQDFAHILIALGRQIGVPCRYVSGYLFHQPDHADRSSDGATHAWVEALMPELGWIGFDPTNDLVAAARHIRVAIGRDYADVPPTRGVFKGISAVRSELAVAVNVASAQAAIPGDAAPFVPWMSREAASPRGEDQSSQQQ
jgi:transglutaminase-like putative cysteine protease